MKRPFRRSKRFYRNSDSKFTATIRSMSLYSSPSVSPSDSFASPTAPEICLSIPLSLSLSLSLSVSPSLSLFFPYPLLLFWMFELNGCTRVRHNVKGLTGIANTPQQACTIVDPFREIVIYRAAS